MIIVSSFRLIHNSLTGIFTIVTEFVTELIHSCPLCNGGLKYRNSKPRDLKDMVGEVRHFLLRRLRCQQCKKLHTEIPDIIQPYKHYDSKTIQTVIDGDKDENKCVADNSTIRRWKTTFAKAEPDIAQRLTSVYAQATEEKCPIGVVTQMLSKIRASHKYWLAFVMKLLINSGHKLCTQFAFCPIQFTDKVEPRNKN